MTHCRAVAPRRLRERPALALQAFVVMKHAAMTQQPRKPAAATPARRLPTWPSFPELTFFVRLLAVHHPDLVDEAAELLSIYIMDWHGGDDQPPEDNPLAFVASMKHELGRDSVDRLYTFENQFTLHLRCDLALYVRHGRPPHTVSLDPLAWLSCHDDK